MAIIPRAEFRGQALEWLEKNRWVNPEAILNFVIAKYVMSEIENDPSQNDGKHGILWFRKNRRNSVRKIMIKVHEIQQYGDHVLNIYGLHDEPL